MGLKSDCVTEHRSYKFCSVLRHSYVGLLCNNIISIPNTRNGKPKNNSVDSEGRLNNMNSVIQILQISCNINSLKYQRNGDTTASRTHNTRSRKQGNFYVFHPLPLHSPLTNKNTHTLLQAIAALNGKAPSPKSVDNSTS